MSDNLGLDPEQLLVHVIRPTLKYIGWHSIAAEQLVLGTGITESRLRYLKQIGGGPAMGIYQMEPNTFRDIKQNFLAYQDDAYEVIESLRDHRDSTQEEELCYNLAYATAMCRAHYRRMPAKLPEKDNATLLTQYWKQYYNTGFGAGTITGALPHFDQAIEVVRLVR
jgi:hypothetical protein